MEELLELAQDLYRKKVHRARQKPVEQKLMLGCELFDDVRERMIWGIQSEHPDFSQEQVHREFLRRLSISRRLEQRRLEHT